MFQSGRSFRPLKYLQLVKMFGDCYDKVVKHRGAPRNDDKEPLTKAFVMRSFAGLLNIFETNQKLEVDYVPKKKKSKKTVKIREVKGHQLVQKPHSPQYTCPCQRKKVDDFVSCSCKLCRLFFRVDYSCDRNSFWVGRSFFPGY